MTLLRLKSYRKLLKEKKDLELKGVGSEAKQRVKAIGRELSAITTFILGCDDFLIKHILIYRFIDGLSWDAVAARIGGGNTADNCRKLVTRYMSRKM